MNNNDTNFNKTLYRGSYQNEQIVSQLSETLYSTLLTKTDLYDFVIICIGTDRSTGDALGPIVGSKLKKLFPKHATIYGTLDNPVHAVNLTETLEQINSAHTNPYILAIDASLGKLNSVGALTLATGPLRPGAGVQKKLPEVGDIHLTGIVNVGGFMEYFVLQNTRLSIVMHMADKIASAIYFAMVLIEKKKRSLLIEELPS